MYSNDANIVSRSPSKNSYIREYFDFNRLGFGLQRLARSTRVKDVRIEMQPRLTEVRRKYKQDTNNGKSKLATTTNHASSVLFDIFLRQSITSLMPSSASRFVTN